MSEHCKVTQVSVKVELNESSNMQNQLGLLYRQGESDNKFGEVMIDEAFYEDIEYLEEDIVFEETGMLVEESKVYRSPEKIEPTVEKRLDKRKSYKRCMQYKKSDLRNAMLAIRRRSMSILEASDFFKVPSKVLANHLKTISNRPKLFRRPAYYTLRKGIGDTTSEVKRYTKCFQYTEEDMRNALEAVKEHRLTQIEAAQYYNVPKKTLSRRINPKVEDPDKTENSENMYSFIKEIKKILSFTNATPFKSYRTLYMCAYCTEFTTRDDEELRNHTRVAHIIDRTNKVDLMMRPHCFNEILRLDVKDLLCVVCCITIDGWHSMFQHLKTHNVHLDLAYKRLIPFALDTRHQCILCQEEFNTYMVLDCHMNTHFSNYVCNDCGDGFFTNARLKNHMKWKKMKPSKVLLDRDVPLRDALKTKCPYCLKSFSTPAHKWKHLLKWHEDKLQSLTCKECGRKFKRYVSYLKHVKNVHCEKSQCPLCGMLFNKNSELEWHVTSKHS